MVTKIDDDEWRALTADIEHALVQRVGLSDGLALLAGSIPTTVSGARVFDPLFGDIPLGLDQFKRRDYEREKLPAARKAVLSKHYLLQLPGSLTDHDCHLGDYDFKRRRFEPGCALMCWWGGARSIDFGIKRLEWNIEVPEDDARELRSKTRDRDLYAEIVLRIKGARRDKVRAKIDAAIVQNKRSGEVLYRKMPKRLPNLGRGR